MTIRANFSDSGLSLGHNSSNMTYLYGLSDFFSVMFEDTSTVNLLLEAESEVASEVYSRFLQYTSTMTLKDVQEVTNSTVKLVTINSTDAVPGKINTYKLPDSFRSTRYVANRAFLPTELLEDGVDFSITRDSRGSSYITFAAPLGSYAFPLRLLPDGTTQQHALWFVDAEIDEGMIQKYFGNLIGVSPENANEQFANFVYGLFYVYVNGPKLDMLSRGLNLALGIPLARATEEVIDIRVYLETDQYIVICDQNQYIIPYGLTPTVRAGETIQIGQSLAQWVEIKDHQTDKEWWVNLHIPEKLIPEIPAGQKDRYATLGSHYDYLMRNFLKKNTFMVKVKVQNFKNIQQFSQISDIIQRAKPTFTECIYIWSVESLIEKLDPQDTLKTRLDAKWDDHFKVCISRMRRDNSDDPILRGTTSFIRYNLDKKYIGLFGEDPYTNQRVETVGADIITGYVNPISQFRTNTGQEKGWMRAILARGHDVYRGYRDKLGFHRGALDLAAYDGLAPSIAYSSWDVPIGMRVVPLYTTTLSDVITKASIAGFDSPQPNQWYFEFFSAKSLSEAINDLVVNYGRPVYDPALIRHNYFNFFFRTNGVGYFGREFPEASFTSWAPKESDVNLGDYILCIRITEDVVGVYWVTSNQSCQAPSYFAVGEIDPLVVTYNMPLSRGGGINGAPFYVLRGAGQIDYNNVNAAINDAPINDRTDVDSSGINITYTDKYNLTPVSINRGGVVIKHAVESL